MLSVLCILGVPSASAFASASVLASVPASAPASAPASVPASVSVPASASAPASASSSETPSASPNPSVSADAALAPAAARRWRGGLSLEFGTLTRPSGCPGYCQDAYGPALGVAIGRALRPTLTVLLEGWLFQREALALAAGVQHALGGRAWVRGSAGVMSTVHHNADGGDGEGVGPALSVSGGVRLAELGGVSTELLMRATAVVHEVGHVTSLSVGYGLAW